MNGLSPQLIAGTLGELLVQAHLLQFDVQAAPPLKDTGNDLIAVRRSVFRAIQVKATEGDSYAVPEDDRHYHILAAVRLVGEGHQVCFGACEIFLIRKEELPGLPRQFAQIGGMKLGWDRINELFPIAE